jgi:hypothetical protein
MSRLEIERKILHYSRQIPNHKLLEVLHYLELLNQQKAPLSKPEPVKRFNTMKVPQVIVSPREELHER